MKEMKSFESLGLSTNVLKAINDKGFEEPTAIQEMSIPVMLDGKKNIIAQAQTGTGKTAAFGLPLMDIINTKNDFVQALILTPTRELAIQVSEEINSFKSDKSMRIIPIYGGQSISQQLRRLKKGVHIVVGTPGRVIDHINRGTLKLNKIEHLILDEADEMLNMGFIDDMEEIMKHTNPDKKTMLFSATMPKRIKDLAKKYMDGYEHLKVEKQQLTTNLTEQIYFEVRTQDKFEALCRIIDIEEEFYGLIFCRTKRDVNNVVVHLNDRGYDAEPLHGDISQAQRERTLRKFKKQVVNILVATDVAARGIDVNNLTHVINYSLPQDPESYVHRIGRTGRAGNEGTAITFITPGEYKKLMFIQRIAKAEIKKSKIPNVDDIISTKQKKISEKLEDCLNQGVDEKYNKWSEQLLEDVDAKQLIASLLQYSFKNELDPDSYGKIKEIKDIKSRTRKVDGTGKARLFVALGKNSGYTPKKLVNLILKRTDVKNDNIDDVIVLEKFSFITVPFEDAEVIIRAFQEKGKRPVVSHAKKSRTDSKKKKRN